MAVVVGGHEADPVGEQHPVAEHVAGHVADPDDRERVARGIDLELAQVALDRLPGAARRDPELLVVIAARAARGEGVTEPEAVLLGDRVGGVGERRGALVGGDDEVGVLLVEHAHVRRVLDLAVDEVVGDIEQRTDVGHVLAPHLVPQLLVIGRGPLDVEAALRPRRHDHGVLGQLGAHQAEDLGAVVHAIGPADAAARDPRPPRRWMPSMSRE